ncbi:MAG: IS701 family transposase [Egibacteraceae bacterium]
MNGAAAWQALLAGTQAVFTAPSFGIFADLVTGWALCPGRRTITRIIGIVDPDGRRAHDAYHRFLRTGRWSMAALWQALTLTAVATLCPHGVVALDLDDTLFHKTGRHIAGAGSFRDAIRSTRRRIVYAHGLNLVVLTLRITPPWGGEPLGLPVNMRVYRKGGPTHNELAEAMIEQVAGWLGDRMFRLGCDGAYAGLAGRNLPRTHVVSRMRRDAALYAPAPPRTGKPGRPRKKGDRLPTPTQIAAQASQADWTRATINLRGKHVERLVCSRQLLWYRVCPDRLVGLVIVRDPDGHEPDDFFFTTDLDAAPAEVAGFYAGRWSIEDTFAQHQQFLGGEDPQTWTADGPERAAALSLWLSTAIWLWYIPAYGTTPSWPTLPWYPSKATPSFIDALAALRRTLWRQRITTLSPQEPLPAKITDTLIDTLARAA